MNEIQNFSLISYFSTFLPLLERFALFSIIYPVAGLI